MIENKKDILPLDNCELEKNPLLAPPKVNDKCPSMSSINSRQNLINDKVKQTLNDDFDAMNTGFDADLWLKIQQEMHNKYPCYLAQTYSIAEMIASPPEDITIIGKDDVNKYLDVNYDEVNNKIIRKKELNWDLYFGEEIEDLSALSFFVVYDYLTEGYDPNYNYNVFPIADLNKAKEFMLFCESNLKNKNELPNCIVESIQCMWSPSFQIFNNKQNSLNIIDTKSDKEILKYTKTYQNKKLPPFRGTLENITEEKTYETQVKQLSDNDKYLVKEIKISEDQSIDLMLEKYTESIALLKQYGLEKYLPETHMVVGYNEKKEPTIYLFQEKIVGTTLKDKLPTIAKKLKPITKKIVQDIKNNVIKKKENNYIDYTYNGLLKDLQDISKKLKPNTRIKDNVIKKKENNYIDYDYPYAGLVKDLQDILHKSLQMWNQTSEMIDNEKEKLPLCVDKTRNIVKPVNSEGVFPELSNFNNLMIGNRVGDNGPERIFLVDLGLIVVNPYDMKNYNGYVNEQIIQLLPNKIGFDMSVINNLSVKFENKKNLNNKINEEIKKAFSLEALRYFEEEINISFQDPRLYYQLFY